MRKIMVTAAAALLSVGSAAALEQANVIHVTPPLTPHPMPQGVPYFVEPAVAKPIVALRYAVVDGRRVLVNAETLEIVYILHP